MLSSAQNTKLFLSELTEGINDRKGDINCGHCALRLDEYLAEGKNLRKQPVPKSGAKLYTSPFINRQNKIICSTSDDPRMIDRTTPNKKYFKTSIDIHDGESNLTIDVTQDPQGPSEIRFYPATKVNIKELLKSLPRRQKDHSVYGFIVMTYKANPNQGHIINFYVNNKDDVFFVDAQVHNKNKRVMQDLTNDLMENEIVYRASTPPEGYYIKKEHEENNPVYREGDNMLDMNKSAAQNKKEKTPSKTELERLRQIVSNNCDQTAIDNYVNALIKHSQNKNCGYIIHGYPNETMMTLWKRSPNNSYISHQIKLGIVNKKIHMNMADKDTEVIVSSVLESLSNDEVFTRSYNKIQIASFFGDDNLFFKSLEDIKIGSYDMYLTDFESILKTAAFYGDIHITRRFMIWLKNNINIDIDFSVAAVTARNQGHTSVFEEIMRVIKNDKNQKVHHLALDAAHHGDQYLLKTYIDMMNERGEHIDYRMLALSAKSQNHLKLAYALIVKIMPQDNKPKKANQRPEPIIFNHNNSNNNVPEVDRAEVERLTAAIKDLHNQVNSFEMQYKGLKAQFEVQAATPNTNNASANDDMESVKKKHRMKK